MQKRVILAQLILILMILPLTSAEISLSSPDKLYSAGDSFSLDITLIPLTDVSSFLKATLSCSGEDIEIYRNPFFLLAGKEKKITISSKFDPFFIKDLSGTCFIKTNFAEDSKKSDTFTISRDLLMNVTSDKDNLNPGDTLRIYGNSARETGKLIDGIIEVNSEGISSKAIGGISSGIFSINLTIPEDTPAGSKLIKINSYEKLSNNETLNSGKTAVSIEINQITKELDIAMNLKSINKNNSLRYKVLILDQTSNEIKDLVFLQIIDSKGNIFSEESIKSSLDSIFPVKSDYIPGVWSIKVSYDGHEIEKIFTVEENKELSYEISEGKLTVKNSGNIIYKDTLKIDIGSESRSFDINLDVGKSRIYQLSAPTGSYNIGLTTSEGSNKIGEVSLTGKAISIDDISLGMKAGTIKLLFWLIVIVIFTIIFIFIRRKIRKNGFTFKKKLVDYENKDSQQISKRETITDGKKQQATLISLKIKNYSTIKEDPKAIEAINSALIKAKDVRAKVYVSENHRVIILSPSITGNNENDMEAVSLANKFREIIENYNGNAETKIVFGLGIHSGELILESHKGQSKFTSIGNTISIVKRISETSDSEILVSESVRKKILGKIRAEKITNKLWKISDLKSKYKYEEFIKRFEQRRRESSKK